MPLRSASGKFTTPTLPSINNLRALMTTRRAPGWSKPCLKPPRLNDKGRRWRIDIGRQALYPHRLLWEDTVAPLPDNAMLFRKCSTAGCCEPTHHEVSYRDSFDTVIGLLP
ncbi:MAG: hypothetical protein ACYTEQ_30250 [Planctomycetota bacterium]|jgi:hypothetical protein